MSGSPLPAGAPVRAGQSGEEARVPFGEYTLSRRLGSGGMAELFLATKKTVRGNDATVVIKRILPSVNHDRELIELLRHEGRIARTLSHPNIVRVFDVGEIDGQSFIAMEHIDGEDLRSVLGRMKERGAREFPLEHALAIVLGVSAGLAHAHEQRTPDGIHLAIVHRDVSPQNVIVSFRGDVKIVDFGLATSVHAGEADASSRGKAKGTVSYMSPEQARGEPVDARSDIFGIGVVLFELTTGKRLFVGDSDYETIRLICDREYPRPSEVRPDYPRDLEGIVMRALAKDVNRRYPSVRAMQADLEAFIRDHEIAVSSFGLERFMHGLFDEKVATPAIRQMHGAARGRRASVRVLGIIAAALIAAAAVGAYAVR
jgi:eukaryotic-like serine/threonine-protein kinase